MRYMVYDAFHQDYIPTCVGGGLPNIPCDEELLVCIENESKTMGLHMEQSTLLLQALCNIFCCSKVGTILQGFTFSLDK